MNQTTPNIHESEFNSLVDRFAQTHSELQKQAARAVDIDLIIIKGGSYAQHI